MYENTIRKGTKEGHAQTLAWRGMVMFNASSKADASADAIALIREWVKRSPHMNEYRWQIQFWDGDRAELCLAGDV
jgi:hypothetical protein